MYCGSLKQCVFPKSQRYVGEQDIGNTNDEEGRERLLQMKTIRSAVQRKRRLSFGASCEAVLRFSTAAREMVPLLTERNPVRKATSVNGAACQSQSAICGRSFQDLRSQLRPGTGPPPSATCVVPGAASWTSSGIYSVGPIFAIFWRGIGSNTSPRR